eukprot:3641684-Pleurochrysis_carterae.AAC.1
MFQAISPGDSRTLWPPKPTSVPSPPSPVLDEMRHIRHAVREEEKLEATQDHTQKPIKDAAARRNSRPGVFLAPTQLKARPGHKAAAATVTAVHADILEFVLRYPRARSRRYSRPWIRG